METPYQQAQRLLTVRMGAGLTLQNALDSVHKQLGVNREVLLGRYQQQMKHNLRIIK